MRLLLLAIAGSFLLFGCDRNDGPMEKMGESADQAVDDAKDAMEDAGDEMKDAADDVADEVEDATN
jgi:hypothetical protein